MREPSDFEYAIAERVMMGLPAVGPLTREQIESVEAYERYQHESALEYEAMQAAGGRTICPQCGERSVTHRSVMTYGVVGHPESEFSDLAECERCEYREL